jgi:hypothetical protein
VLEPVALDHLRQRHASGIGMTELGMLDDESVKAEVGLLRVISAERVALDLASQLIVSTGVIAPVWAAPEEPPLHPSSSALMNLAISDSGTA